MIKLGSQFKCCIIKLTKYSNFLGSILLVLLVFVVEQNVSVVVEEHSIHQETQILPQGSRQFRVEPSGNLTVQ